MRVHRSFAFVDVSGFTAPTEHEGDERAVEVLTGFRAPLREICSRRGVRIAKWLGDGAMLVCVETRPLLATILELHHVVYAASGPVQTVSIRSGITSGHVILMEGVSVMSHGGDHLPDPICGLPMSGTTAEETASDHRGDVVLFCSTGCLDTWRSRPTGSDALNEGADTTD